MLIVSSIGFAVVGFVVVSLVRGNRSSYRNNTAIEIAGLLQKARADSMRRRPKDLNQMAQVKFFNRKFYSAVRAGLISGNNLPALAGNPDAGKSASGESRLTGAIHNFLRFLEKGVACFNFAGFLIPLFRSTLALGSYNADSTIYGAPVRNWAFDSTFLDPNRLPPSKPQFQYVQPTAFRQLL